MQKGIFWISENSAGERIIVSVKTGSGEKGNTDKTVIFSSKSGSNFSHKKEWEKMDRSVTHNHSFDYYPRGRVEIMNGKPKVFLNPDLNSAEIHMMIEEEFDLPGTQIRYISDGSVHYGYRCENPAVTGRKVNKQCHL